MTPITRAQANAIQDYVDNVHEGDFDLPSNNTLRGISTLLDGSAQRVFDRYRRAYQQTGAFEKGVKELKKAPRVCGGFKRPKKVVLAGKSAFEQMAVLAEWVDRTNIQQKHTIAMRNSEEEIVPIWVKPPRNGNGADLFHVVLGTGARGALRDPTYSDWVEENPQGNDYNLLIAPLNHLEIERQPHLAAALLLKANPYERETGGITHVWRYQNDEPTASVEIPGQKNKTARTRATVEQSAGYNLAQMVDELYGENLLPERRYEDFSDEGYDDDATPVLEPGALLDTLPLACSGNRAPLDKAMEKLFVTQMQVPHETTLKAKAISVLFPQ